MRVVGVGGRGRYLGNWKEGGGEGRRIWEWGGGGGVVDMSGRVSYVGLVGGMESSERLRWECWVYWVWDVMMGALINGCTG